MTPDTPEPPPRPIVIWLFKLYCVFIILCGLFSIGFGGVVLTFNPPAPSPARTEGIQIAALYFFMGAASALPALLGIFIPRKPWGWTYSMILLGLSMLGCVCIPPAVLLLIFYLRPNVKAFYGKT